MPLVYNARTLANVNEFAAATLSSNSFSRRASRSPLSGCGREPSPSAIRTRAEMRSCLHFAFHRTVFLAARGNRDMEPMPLRLDLTPSSRMRRELPFGAIFLSTAGAPFILQTTASTAPLHRDLP